MHAFLHALGIAGLVVFGVLFLIFLICAAILYRAQANGRNPFL
jgi:hypothetical protein